MGIISSKIFEHDLDLDSESDEDVDENTALNSSEEKKIEAKPENSKPNSPLRFKRYIEPKSKLQSAEHTQLFIGYMKLNNVEMVKKLLTNPKITETLENYVLVLDKAKTGDYLDTFSYIMQNTKMPVTSHIVRDDALTPYVPYEKMYNHYLLIEKRIDVLDLEPDEDDIIDLRALLKYGIMNKRIHMLSTMIAFMSDADIFQAVWNEQFKELILDEMVDVELIHLFLVETEILTKQDLSPSQLEAYEKYIATLFAEVFEE